ncbi:MAG: cytochrome c [Chloracidobacterium sp.]|nr:cytochrome c [Chloracidobacterium sp.]
MNSLKLVILISVFSAFVFSCAQPPTTSNVNNTNVSRTVENVPVSTNSTTSVANNLRAGRSAAVTDTAVDDKPVDLYAQNCMICHKDSGKGGKMTLEGKTISPDDLTSAKIKAKSDDKLLAEIKQGVPDEGMPAFKGKLSDEEIKSIIQKIRKF